MGTEEEEGIAEGGHGGLGGGAPAEEGFGEEGVSVETNEGYGIGQGVGSDGGVEDGGGRGVGWRG